MIRTARRAGRAALATVGSLVLVAGLSACSSMGSEPDDDDPAPGGDGQVTGIRTTATLGKVTGKLERERRAALRENVTATFDGWVDAAYLSGGGAADAFGAFTKDAAALAKRDRAQMSNADLDADTITATGRKLTIDVLAHKGRPVGITGRFVLVFEIGDDAGRTDRVVGRLLMRRGEGGWKIFGYDVKRGKVA